MDQNKTAKYKFTDDYGDTIDVYQRGNQIFIDGTFEYGRMPDFREYFRQRARAAWRTC